MSETDCTALPVHPFTGLRAVGIVAGRPVWPIRGGSVDPPNEEAPPEGTPETGDPEPEGEQQPETDLAKELEKWKAQARKNEQRAKENAAKAKRFDDFEEAQKTETQKLQDQLAAAKADAEAATLKALRAEVASSTGVPAELLVGSTEDELRASADALQQFKGETPKAPPAKTAQGKQGAPIDGDKQLTQEDVKRLYAEKKYSEIDKAREEGRLTTLLGG